MYAKHDQIDPTAALPSRTYDALLRVAIKAATKAILDAGQPFPTTQV